MSKKQWWNSLPPMSMADPFLERMKQRGLALTRENYIATAGLEEPLDAEEEWLLPPEFSRVERPQGDVPVLPAILRNKLSKDPILAAKQRRLLEVLAKNADTWKPDDDVAPTPDIEPTADTEPTTAAQKLYGR